jgi:hypothetical protein
VLNYTKGEPAKTDMLSTINIGVGCFVVSMSQYVIGWALSLGGSHEA